MNIEEAKKEICLFARRVYEKGMVCGSGGNISVKLGDKIYITPRGYSLSNLSPDEIVEVDLSGKYSGDIVPSKETELHLASYSAVDSGKAIIHVHSYYSIIAGIHINENGGKPMPAYTASYAVKVKEPQMIPFFPSGSAELRAAAKDVLRKSNIAFMLNHGIIIVTDELQQAYNLAEEVEMNARLYFDLQGKGALTSEQTAAARQASAHY